MLNENWNKEISIYGSQKEIDFAKYILKKLVYGKEESTNRLIIQNAIDKNKIKASILYNGNSVWSFNKVIKDIKTVKKLGMNKMTNYLYKFLSSSCGSIAHYNKQGWINCYPTIGHLRMFFRKNEFGRRVLDYVPMWKTDRKKIVREIEKELKIGIQENLF